LATLQKRWDALLMFEHFNERARHVVVLAQQSARDLGHNYIGTEHELLGLMREQEGIAARVLVALGLTETRICDDVVRIVGRASEEVTPGQIPFTPRAKAVLEAANRERHAFGELHVGTEHILLGLLRGGEGIGLRVLCDAGFSPETIRNELIRTRNQQPMRHTLNADRAVPPPEWLTTVAAVLSPLGSEIRRTHGREPDTGDLLLVLACLPELPVAGALQTLDVDRDTLSEVIRTARQSGAPEAPEAETIREIRRLLALPEPR
jgi:Clp amino terminal domain, pathogenicity island component